MAWPDGRWRQTFTSAAQLSGLEATHLALGPFRGGGYLAEFRVWMSSGKLTTWSVSAALCLRADKTGENQGFGRSLFTDTTRDTQEGVGVVQWVVNPGEPFWLAVPVNLLLSEGGQWVIVGAGSSTVATTNLVIVSATAFGLSVGLEEPGDGGTRIVPPDLAGAE